MNDFERFVAMMVEFGVTVVTENDTRGGVEIIAVTVRSEDGPKRCGPGEDTYMYQNITDENKIRGYGGFVTEFLFRRDTGKFIYVGLWE